MTLSKHIPGFSMRNAPGALFLAAALCLSACGGGGGAGADPLDPIPPTSDDPPTSTGSEDGPTLVGTGSGGTDDEAGAPSSSRPMTLEESLKKLAKVKNEKRRHDKEELPDTFGPFGSRWEYSRKAEVFLAGIGTAAWLSDDWQYANPKTLDRIPASETPWMNQRTEIGDDPDLALTARVQRDFVAADVDGDGLDEIIAVRIEEGMLKLWMRDSGRAKDGDAAQEGALDGVRSEQVLGTQSFPKSVTIEAVDLEGNGTQSLIVAAEVDTGLRIQFVSLEDGVWRIHAELTRLLPVTPNHTPILKMATGNLDLDTGEETVLVLNEAAQGRSLGFDRGAWIAYAYVLDDLPTSRSGGHTGMITVLDRVMVGLQNPLQPETPVKLIRVDVAVGDFDDDGLDEIAFSETGIRNWCPTCPGNIYPELGLGMWWISGVILDDRRAGFAQLATFSDQMDQDYPGNTEHRLSIRRFASINAVNIDNRGGDEFQVHAYVRKLVRNADGSYDTQLVGTIPHEVFHSPSDGVTSFTHVTADIAIGDVNGDGNDDISIFHGGRGKLQVYGMTQPDPMVPASFGRIKNSWISEWRSPGPGVLTYPVLLLPNVDDDSVTLSFEPGASRFTYTRPIIHAVLAAPPWSEGIGQNVAASTTELSWADSKAKGEDLGFTVTASAWIGMSLQSDLLQSGIEVKATQTHSLSRFVSKDYEVTESITYGTGPNEDRVIFTTLPVDIYEYVIRSHPNPELIGKRVFINLPREPITTHTSVEYYNEHVIEGAFQVGTNVLPHTVGDHLSYLRRHQAEKIPGAIVSNASDSGQGSDAYSTKTVEVSQRYEESIAHAHGIEASVEVTAGGALAGFSWGISSEHALRVSTTARAAYSVTVGTVEDGSTNGFSWGLFTYFHKGGNQHFLVLSAWVNPGYEN